MKKYIFILLITLCATAPFIMASKVEARVDGGGGGGYGVPSFSTSHNGCYINGKWFGKKGVTFTYYLNRKHGTGAHKAQAHVYGVKVECKQKWTSGYYWTKGRVVPHNPPVASFIKPQNKCLSSNKPSVTRRQTNKTHVGTIGSLRVKHSWTEKGTLKCVTKKDSSGAKYQGWVVKAPWKRVSHVEPSYTAPAGTGNGGTGSGGSASVGSVSTPSTPTKLTPAQLLKLKRLMFF